MSVSIRVAGFLLTMVATIGVLSAPAFGSTWTTQPTFGPTGLAESALSSVSCASPSSCMAVGVDDNGPNSSGTSLVGVGSFAESWNGSAWAVLPTAGSAASPSLYSVSCASAVFCVAVGASDSVGGEILNNEDPSPAERALVEVWNGATWTVSPNPGAALSASGLFGVSCTSSRFCIAVGEHGYNGLAEVWNGTGWRIQTMPTVAKYGTWPTGISCLAADWCTLVGGYNADMRRQITVGVPLAEHWNGRRWSEQHAPAYGLYFPTLSSVSCVSRSFCFASGTHYLDQQGTPSPFAERWNGQSWTAARAGLPKYGWLNSVSCLSTVDCIAAGQFDPSLFAGPEPTEPLVESWNGARWQRLTTPNAPSPPTTNGYFNTRDPALFGLSCRSDSGCTAVGDQANGSESAPLAQREAGPLSASGPTPGAQPPPVFGQTATVTPVSGRVLVELPGGHQFVPLSSVSSFPLGSLVDTTAGKVRLTTARSSTGGTEAGLFYGGIFRVTQARARSGVRGGQLVGLTVLTLAGPSLSGCTSARDIAGLAGKRPKKRVLWGNAKGNYTSVGGSASATVRGTEWLTEDTCAGTLIRVVHGVVSVNDFVHHRSFLLHAGQSYVAHRRGG